MDESITQRIVRVKDLWYLEQGGRFEGPFDSADEAGNYLRLTRSAEAARMEFAGLASVADW